MRLREGVLAAILVATGNAVLSGCAQAPGDDVLPPPEAPVRLEFACYPPSLGAPDRPPPPPPPPPPWTAQCLKDSGRFDEYVVVVQLDHDGTVVDAFVRQDRSTGMDACILKRVRTALGGAFSPGRDCLGNPVASEFLYPYGALYPEPLDLGREVPIPASGT